MRRTQHTAMLAAEQIAAGVDWEKIEAEELSSLESMCRAHLQDREHVWNEDKIEKYLHINGATKPIMKEKISRTYIIRTGGGFDADDIWYDEDEITCYEGDECPQCNKGVLKVSRNRKLYCSEICWEKDDNES